MFCINCMCIEAPTCSLSSALVANGLCILEVSQGSLCSCSLGNLLISAHPIKSPATNSYGAAEFTTILNCGCCVYIIMCVCVIINTCNVHVRVYNGWYMV